MSNVFGSVIDDVYVMTSPEYLGKSVIITKKDRAHVALTEQYSRENRANAVRYVEWLNGKCGVSVSTMCLLYNATGDPITFVNSHDWDGHIGSAPYPHRIGNGQWAAWLHQKEDFSLFGSSGAVVYRTSDTTDSELDYMVAWDTSLMPNSSNKAFTEIGINDQFQGLVWKQVKKSMDNSGYHSEYEWSEWKSIVSTASGFHPYFVTTLTLKDSSK